MRTFAKQTGKRFESENLKLIERAFTYASGQTSEQSIRGVMLFPYALTYSELEEVISVSWVSSTITEYLIHMASSRYTYLSVRKLFFAKQFYRLGR